MNILFLNAYFYPETISFSHLERDLIEGLVNNGDKITVICPVPTRGITSQVAKQYRSIRSEQLYDGKVEVIRFWAPQEGKNPLVRASRYFWCNLREYQLGKKLKNVDAVFAVSTPPTQGLISGTLGKKLKCPVIYSLQDVFPDSLVTTGLTSKGSIIWKIGKMIEDKTYRLCKKIIVISETIKNNLTEKGVDEEKIATIPNWIDTGAITPVPRNANTLIEEFGIDPNKFIVVYAGNFGTAQGAEIVIDAAEALSDMPRIQFAVFGTGVGFAAAKERADKLGLNNIILNPLLPKERISEVYSLGDVSLIICKKNVGGSAMPSKAWSIMACDTPIIASFDTDSELAYIIGQAGAGACVEPENCQLLCEAIKAEYDRFCIEGHRKTNTSEFVKENFSKQKSVGNYVSVFNNL